MGHIFLDTISPERTLVAMRVLSAGNKVIVLYLCSWLCACSCARVWRWRTCRRPPWWPRPPSAGSAESGCGSQCWGAAGDCTYWHLVSEELGEYFTAITSLEAAHWAGEARRLRGCYWDEERPRGRILRPVSWRGRAGSLWSEPTLEYTDTWILRQEGASQTGTKIK